MDDDASLLTLSTVPRSACSRCGNCAAFFARIGTLKFFSYHHAENREFSFIFFFSFPSCNHHQVHNHAVLSVAEIVMEAPPPHQIVTGARRICKKKIGPLAHWLLAAAAAAVEFWVSKQPSRFEIYCNMARAHFSCNMHFEWIVKREEKKKNRHFLLTLWRGWMAFGRLVREKEPSSSSRPNDRV